jgi:hypothetical protein
VHVVEPELNVTEMSFHVELGIEQLSAKEVRAVENKYHKRRPGLGKAGQAGGHLISARSCRESVDALNSSYQPVNFAPQDPDLNQSNWKWKEDHIIKLAKYYNVSTFTGVVRPPEGPVILDANSKKEIVPAYWWSLSVLEKEGHPPLYDAFLAENVKPTSSFWKSRCSVERLREVTGWEFFAGMEQNQPKQLAEVGRAKDHELLIQKKRFACTFEGCEDRFETKDGLYRHSFKHVDPKRFEKRRVMSAASSQKSIAKRFRTKE